jgi:hypothetical protein
LTLFDGVGFADKAYRSAEGHGLYATYKLALALYVADAIGEAPDEAILDALLSKQDPSGGFTSLYDDEGRPQGDTNTETTSYALLALGRLQEYKTAHIDDEPNPALASQPPNSGFNRIDMFPAPSA